MSRPREVGSPGTSWAGAGPRGLRPIPEERATRRRGRWPGRACRRACAQSLQSPPLPAPPRQGTSTQDV